jgi:hypothetical protein
MGRKCNKNKREHKKWRIFNYIDDNIIVHGEITMLQKNSRSKWLAWKLISEWEGDAGQQAKELKPGKERSLEEEEEKKKAKEKKRGE